MMMMMMMIVLVLVFSHPYISHRVCFVLCIFHLYTVFSAVEQTEVAISMMKLSLLLTLS